MSASPLFSRQVLALAAVAAVVLAGCGHQPPPRDVKPPEVFVTLPIYSTVADYQDFTGRLSAIKTVDIRPRVTGYVNEANFKDGDLVRKGDILFRIDPSSYRADANQAQANLNLARAERNLQEKIARRMQQLYNSRAASQEEYEQSAATVEKNRATVEAMEASKERAQIYLDWTTVKAPLSGRISRRLVDPGNLVNADNTILTTIVTEDPLYAYFDVDERTFLNLTGHKSPSAALSAALSSSHLPVLMRLANEDDFLDEQGKVVHLGVVDFIDNQVTSTTGTIRFRGVFPNPSRTLKPGLFARIRLPIGLPYQALLVPDEALMSDQGRKFVYVVKKHKNAKGEEEERVEYRKVTPGQAVSTRKKQKNAKGEEEEIDYRLRVLQPAPKDKQGKEGVAEGERVVIVGMQRVRPGVPVTARSQAPPPPPEVPFVKMLAFEPPAPAPKGPERTGLAPEPEGKGAVGQGDPGARPKGSGRPASGGAQRGG